MSDWRHDVLTYWFGLTPEDWWRSGPAIDAEIRDRFLQLWERKRELPVDSFLDDPLTALAAVILFDQFPRNLFRDHADQFATDHLALAISKAAVAREYDAQLKPIERNFLYMPFEHSESLADQNQSVLLQTATGNDVFADASRKHRAIIERFGRFPHRNAMLGRASRSDEIATGNPTPW